MEVVSLDSIPKRAGDVRPRDLRVTVRLTHIRPSVLNPCVRCGVATPPRMPRHACPPTQTRNVLFTLEHCTMPAPAGSSNRRNTPLTQSPGFLGAAARFWEVCQIVCVVTWAAANVHSALLCVRLCRPRYSDRGMDSGTSQSREDYLI